MVYYKKIETGGNFSIIKKLKVLCRFFLQAILAITYIFVISGCKYGNRNNKFTMLKNKSGYKNSTKMSLVFYLV